MTPGDILLQRVIETRRFDDETGPWLIDALVRWDRDGGDAVALLRYARLSTTPDKRRQAVRDRWLCAASDILGGANVRERARRLDAECKRFRRLWDVWQHMPAPPSWANNVEGCLFYARRADRIPGEKQLSNILREAFSPRSFRANPDDESSFIG